METAPYIYGGLDDKGFDAAVRINEPVETAAEARTRVFTLKVERAFANIGDARAHRPLMPNI